MATQEHWVTTDRGRIYTKRWIAPSAAPAAAPIVLFHDSLGCVELWRDFPGQLARATDRDVIAYDRLGFGKSEAHHGTLRNDFIHDEARVDFHSVRDQLAIRTFVAFGHSVGGGMAVGCAAAYPDDCSALITESAQAFVEACTIKGIVEAKENFRQPGQLERLKKYHGDKAAWVLHAWTDTWLAADFATWHLDDDLRRLRCPVLAMHGDKDEFGSLLQPRRIVDLGGTRSTLEILAQCGHVPHHVQRDVVLSLVGRWLGSQLRDGSRPS
ncbi:alpha/beta fold hydrolase [Dyella amyloliquefaciens]|uniref:alpha/beta fold hydrolase n=1 Tax=Dyella amyloliquefaciens TaxID=1770545 RepID=UPI001E3B7A60|nr:alpha/beta hydrolase [Dyella amyloliquefaciens]